MKTRPIALRMRRCAGFTLVEAIVVIVITGIIAGMVAVFIRSPVDSYVDSTRRAELTDAADTALRRITRDVRTALPNSFRLVTPQGSRCVEFLPTVGGGRYRAEKSESGTGNVLDFSVVGGVDRFDMLASNNSPDTPVWPGNSHVVVYNLGANEDDAYTGNNRAQILSVAAGGYPALVTLTGNKKFPHESPGRRFHVIPNYSVIYSCSAGVLYRSEISGISSSAPSCPTTGKVLVSHVDCDNSSFKYSVVSAANSLLAITLTLKHAQSGESVRIYHEVQVSNVP